MKLKVCESVVEKEELDVEEAKTILSAYISSVVKKALRFIRENSKQNDKEALLSQIEACNELIKMLANIARERNIEDFKIEEEGEVLTALYSKINSIKAVKERLITGSLIIDKYPYIDCNYTKGVISEFKAILCYRRRRLLKEFDN